MGKLDCAKRWIVVLTVVTVLFGGCATIPELKLLYQLPPPRDRLRGQTVFLSIQDARATKDIISEGASEEFRGFTGYISLSVARSNEPGFKMGAYDFNGLMREAFRRSLETHGIRISEKQRPSEPELRVIVNAFTLDLVDRNWVSTMAYEAKLMMDDRILAKQMVSGSAERAKILGKIGADKAVSEVFSDTVNQLDIEGLFSEADLLR
jgi:uncharacterized lipoprotein YajG